MSRSIRMELPSLAKEGWPRHQLNGPVPLQSADGWFVQLPIIGGWNEPPRLRPLRRLRRFFLMGAATPPLPRSIQSRPAGQLHNSKEVAHTAFWARMARCD